MHKWLGVVFCSGALLMGAVAGAQTLGEDEPASQAPRFGDAAQASRPESVKQQAPLPTVDEAAEAAEIKAGREAESLRQSVIQQGSMPKRKNPAANVAPLDLPNVPTADGSPRGNVAVNRILQPGEQPDENEDDELIFLYYKDYAVRRMAGGRVECDVKFVALTTLNQKLSNLSIKLRWPKMTTSVVFLDVNPNIQVYHTYTLMGEGCYSMDKIPNIIVNRCRIKGMSQKDCAKKIRWLKIS